MSVKYNSICNALSVKISAARNSKREVIMLHLRPLFLRTLFFIAFCLPILVLAAEKPPQLEPLPEPPPAPNGYTEDADVEPQITITKRGEDTVEEYRINNELYQMKVTPPHGIPYYLVKESKNGGWARMDGPSETLAIPQWVLFRF
jgi:hypothetical protein